MGGETKGMMCGIETVGGMYKVTGILEHGEQRDDYGY